jgi:hypothetical protein
MYVKTVWSTGDTITSTLANNWETQYSEVKAEVEKIDGTSGIKTDWSNLANKPTSFTPSAHKASHASGGSDPLTPADIGAETPAGAQSKADTAESNAKAASVSKAGDTMAGEFILENMFRMRDLTGTDDGFAKVYYEATGTELRIYPADGENTTLSAAMKLRLYYNGAYYDVWHAGNDGAGSGLDAGLLEGYKSNLLARGLKLTSMNSYAYDSGEHASNDIEKAIQATTAWTAIGKQFTVNCDIVTLLKTDYEISIENSTSTSYITYIRIKDVLTGESFAEASYAGSSLGVYYWITAYADVGHLLGNRTFEIEMKYSGNNGWNIKNREFDCHKNGDPRRVKW